MKKIAVFTTTRADFGILYPFLREIKCSKNLQLLLFVGGAHLTSETGNTINEIKNRGIEITGTFDYLLNSDEEVSIVKSMGIAMIELATIFSKFQFDLVCVLGDRYELLPIVSNSILFRKPIVHIHGGERSEGAIDEQIRHMITKASHLHFTICDEYYSNVVKMGEEKWRVFNTGALATDNMSEIKSSRNVIFNVLGLTNNLDTILLTYHPVTLESSRSPLEQVHNLFEAIKKFNFQVVVTSPNVDKGNEEINKYILNQISQNNNFHFFKSLGSVNYLSLIPYCQFIIGNSSSGIIEVPYFKVPTVNVGDRQKGRLMHRSIITTTYDTQSIYEGIKTAINPDFLNTIADMEYKFGNGTTAKKMVKILERLEINDGLLRKQLTYA